MLPKTSSMVIAIFSSYDAESAVLILRTNIVRLGREPHHLNCSRAASLCVLHSLSTVASAPALSRATPTRPDER